MVKSEKLIHRNQREAGIEIFKLACLNKRFNSIITYIYSPTKLPEFGKNHDLNSFLEMLMTKPALQAKYTNPGLDPNVQVCKKIMESYKNPVHGGKIIEEIGSTKNKKNCLLTDIFKYKSPPNI